jgi:hypothetical protein
MPRLDVYKADITVGPQIRGEVYSYYPIPEGVHRIPQADGSELQVGLSWCRCFVIEAPEVATLQSNNIVGDGVIDPEHPDGSVILGPRVVLDRAHYFGTDFKLVRIYWRFWENRESIARFEASLRAAAEAEGKGQTETS